MPTQPIFLGRQPILDREQRVVAYELLFRSGDVAEACVTDDVVATASVIRHAFTEFGAQRVLGPHVGFINVAADTLLSTAIELLPVHQVVLELLESIVVDEAIVARCRELKARGYQLALDDFVYAPHFEPLLALVDVVKVDLTLHTPDALSEVVTRLRRWPLRLLAEKVDSAEQAAHCQALGFDLFQGYYFARPSVLTSARARPAQGAVTRLLALTLQDADSDAIEAVFKQHPELTLNLMRLVNSVAAGVPRTLGSVGEALLVLGRRQLARWLQLLLYTLKPGTPYPSPLLLLAATRGAAMERLAGMLGQPVAACDEAFMAGIFSLIDSLIDQPLGDLVEEMQLSPRLAAALLAREGEVGLLLRLVESAERGDLSRTLALLKEAGLTLSELTVAQIDATMWVNQIIESPP